MKKFMKKRFRYGEKGFTLIELLIVVAILGILAAVIVPNLAGFLSTGQVAAANTEVANVETAALAYYADGADTTLDGDANGAWPDVATDLTPDYLSADSIYNYGFNAWGKVTVTGTGPWPNDNGVIWNIDAHKWIKGTYVPPPA